MDHQEWEQRKRKLQERAERVLECTRMDTSSEDLHRDNHNLRVHQIELEIQNEELRATQLQLEKERARYAHLYHFSPLGFVVLDKAGIIVEANQRFCTMLDSLQSKIIHQPLMRFIHPDDQDVFLGRYSTFFKSPSEKKIEFRLVSTAGGAIFVRLSGCIQPSSIVQRSGQDNSTTLLLVALDDITSQKQAEEALLSAHKLTRSTIDALSATICVLDETGTILAVNKSWCDFNAANGKEQAVWEGVNYLKVCDGSTGEDSDYGKRFAAGIRSVMCCEAEYHELEYPCLLDDGYHWFVGRITPLEGECDKAQRKVVISHEDITVRKKSEALLHDFNRKLQERIDAEMLRIERLQREKDIQQMALIQQNKMAELGGMIGAITHQWKQPLNSINLLNECLRDAFEHGEIDQAVMNEHIAEVQHLVTFMANTIDDFRDFYLPSKETSRFAVKPVIESVARLLKGQLMKCHIDLTIDGDDALHTSGHSSEFKQVMLNILNNAKDALLEKKPDEKTIKVQVFAEADTIVVTILDNGGGIPEQFLDDAIFEPFFSTKGENGTGIGLSLGKVIVEKNMGGSLTVANRDGGAEFTITLPMI
ncbi:PAS domain-containing sensor histidine kinase [Chrysiogenes arsenatis]|uniref:PAS domain-containing sensor histidine kinase n=1 Tax=Chrysiogenes arsenatis TaxID=309797 RepID=UPI0003F847D7|nr:PAS domain-containing sensor histidine kinase [Chrysiogenes arsenatis]